jgi:hypothetical protein
MSPPMISKAAARYTGAGGKEHCSLCRHFSPRRGGRCARVLGDISPMGWCRLFSREMRGLVADASSFNGGGGPALGLDFMTPGTLDPRITFTRASTGTYFDSAGILRSAAVNAPRWDYDPATLALRGLLIEEARTNVLLNSATLSTQSVTVTAQAYTLSFYGTGTITRSGVSTGALVGTGATQRVSVTFTPTAGSQTCTVTGIVSNAQLEAGAFATSYIPTTSAAVARAADDCKILPSNMAPWFVSPGGSWMAEFLNLDPTTGKDALIIAQLVTGGLVPLYRNSAGNLGQYDGAGIMAAGAVAANVVSKGASTWQVGLAKVCLNGGAVAATAALTGTYAPLATSGVYFLATAVAAPNNVMSGYIRRVRYWSRVLTDGELQQVTTP